MNHKIKNHKFIIIFLLLSGVAFVVIGRYMIASRKPDTHGLTKVEGYAETPCLAMMPGCGLCYGEVINGECYVDKQKLTDEQLALMGLK